MEIVYIEQDNVVLHRNSEHLVLKKMGRKIQSISLIDVKCLVLFNSVQITSYALDLLFEKNIDVIYCSKSGKIRSRLVTSRGGGAILRLAQSDTFFNMDRRRTLACKS